MFLEHITKEGERWDSIAYFYYGDASLYEQIIVANPGVAINPTLPSGIALSIPIIERASVTQETPPWLR